MAAKEKIKLQVSVSRELCERIDALANEIGMDRSQLCAYFLYKQVKQEEMNPRVIANIKSQK
jgi:L-ribulose-5-phosphate 3-epimerase UlaE